jgi:lipoate-protein ligase A
MNQSQDEFDNGYMRLYIDKIRNPETTVDRMLYFCVDKKSVSIREENESEHEAHLQLLQKGKSSKFGDYEKEGLSKKDLDEKRKKANDFIESWQNKG